MTTVDCYVSLNSPWTYLGSQRFYDIARDRGIAVRIKPAKFTEVFSKTGGLPLPKRSPERQAYRLMELRRWAEYRDLPLVMEPKYFPSDETKGVRLVIAADLKGLDAHRLSLEIGRALWERNEALSDDVALAAAAGRAGLHLADILQGVPPEAELDAMHDANTVEAIKRGVFGAPSYVLPSGEIFWGQDRLEFVDRALG